MSNISIDAAANKYCPIRDIKCRTTLCMAWIKLIRKYTDSSGCTQYIIDPKFGRCGLVQLECKHE